MVWALWTVKLDETGCLTRLQSGDDVSSIPHRLSGDSLSSLSGSKETGFWRKTRAEVGGGCRRVIPTAKAKESRKRGNASSVSNGLWPVTSVTLASDSTLCYMWIKGEG